MLTTHYFEFPSFIREEFDKKIKALNKKLAKIKDANEVSIVSESEYFKPYLKPHARNKTKPTPDDYLDVLFTQVEISLPITNKIPGFQYEGTINIEGGVKTIFAVHGRNLTDLDPNHCDHCNSKRKRNRVHVFTNVDSNDLITIGSSCVHQYIGLDIDSALRVFYRIFDQAKITQMVYESSVWGFDMKTIAIATLHAHDINPNYVKNSFNDGYQYRKNSDSSRELVSEVLSILWSNHPDHRARQQSILAKVDRARDMVKLMLDQFSNVDPSAGNFESNLYNTLFVEVDGKTKFRDFLVGKSLGLFIWASYKALNTKTQVDQVNTSSEWIGATSDHLNTTAKVTFLKECSTDWGTSRLVKMETPEGNIVKTFTTAKNVWDLAIGDQIKIKGTISSHDEFKGTKETTIKRPKFFIEEMV